MSRQTVELYFDFACPWSYLALLRLQDVCERNRAVLNFKPVSLERILATENPARLAHRLAENPAKAEWQQKDLDDWARFWGHPIRLAENWPQNRDAAAAAAVSAIKAGEGMRFCTALFRAEFAANEDINSATVLRTAAAAAQLDPAGIAAAASDSDCQVQVQQNSLELIQRGGFGTPSMFIDDELFFGNDRVPLVEWTLGPMGDEAFVIPGQHNA